MLGLEVLDKRRRRRFGERASGCAWAELSESTSLDHGDLIRLFRRTLDVLRTTAGLDPATVPESFAPVRRAERRVLVVRGLACRGGGHPRGDAGALLMRLDEAR